MVPTFTEFCKNKNRTIWNKPHGQFQDGHVEVTIGEKNYNDLIKEILNHAAIVCHNSIQPQAAYFETLIRAEINKL